MGHGGKRTGAGRPPKKEKFTAPAFTIVEGGGPAPAEPDWALMYEDELEVASAREYWRRITEELEATGKLAKANLHQIKRLVAAYLITDKAIEKVAELGPVITGARGGRIINPWLDALKDGNTMALAAEAELTITPRRRNNGGKVQQKKPASVGGGYLRSVPK